MVIGQPFKPQTSHESLRLCRLKTAAQLLLIVEGLWCEWKALWTEVFSRADGFISRSVRAGRLSCLFLPNIGNRLATDQYRRRGIWYFGAMAVFLCEC